MIGDYLRLIRAGYALAREGAFSLAEGQPLPPSTATLIRFARLIERPSVRRTGRADRLAKALTRLGPTYVKFGQLLATRRDIFGSAITADLAQLQDAMPPFDPALVPGLLAEALGPAAAQLEEISEPVAAASIAQVHKALVRTPEGGRKTVAVKILRPGIEERFARDLKALAAAARALEVLMPASKRLRGQQVVETLARSAALEMDLRLEAAAISEIAENTSDDQGFAVPHVHWPLSARTVLVTDWIEAIPVRETERLAAAGIDRPELAKTLIRSFLRQAIRDGFFHADMHPGNLFADPKTGGVVAVDFGITGRISKRERRFLAEVLHGFLTQDYKRIARIHIEIGYVPAHQSVDDFAQALRAIGEPLVGRAADEISMAKVLAQLFDTTELFDMAARPELVLLQKNMVLVEGTARLIDPQFNMWEAAEPVIGDWVRRNVGPFGQIERIEEVVTDARQLAARIPPLVARGERVLALIEAGQLRVTRRDRLGAALKWVLLAAGLLSVLALLRYLFAG